MVCSDLLFQMKVFHSIWRLLVILGGFRWFWVVLGGFGWFWVVLGGFGWFWVVLGGFVEL